MRKLIFTLIFCLLFSLNGHCAFRKPDSWGSTQPQVGSLINWGDPITKGLYAWWLINEGAGGVNSVGLYDSVQKFHGTFQNSPSWEAGRYGRAVACVSGSSQYIDMTTLTSDTIFIGSSNVTFSVSFWFKTSTASFQVILSKEHSSSSAGFDIDIDLQATSSGSLGARWKNNGFNRFGTTNVADGKWHHGVAIITANTSSSTGQNIDIYVDGILANGTSSNSTASAAPGAVSFKLCERTSGANRFNGSLSNVRIYSRDLQPSEVMRLYQEPFAGIDAPKWHMRSQISGNVATPVSVQINNATFNNVKFVY